MKRIIYFFSLLALCQFNASCQSNGPSKAEQSENMQRLAELQNNFDVAYFASGCFWCVEAIYERLEQLFRAIVVVIPKTQPTTPATRDSPGTPNRLWYFISPVKLVSSSY